MFNKIKSVFNNKGIMRLSMINIDDCDIINERILPAWAKSAVVFCIPYRSSVEPASDGFSEYARIYDYHNFSKQLYEETLAELRSGNENNFCGFCDHSPINEKIAAAKCGLGVIGRNSLFIDDVYGSFVFLGSLITDIEYTEKCQEIRSCCNCGACITECPNSAIIEFGIDRTKCLSGISQKKQKTETEKLLLKQHNIIWGCDICQNICPHNKYAIISPIPYFKDTRIKTITKAFIESLNNEEFKKYAFSYKGKNLVMNNIDFV